MRMARRGTTHGPTASSRRDWLRRLGLTATGSATVPAAAAPSAGIPGAQREPWSGAPPNDRLAPVLELVNVPEFEAMARLKLTPDRFESIAGGDRGSFDRMTFRQRLMVYAMELDLTTRLFDYDMFAPIIVGPVGNQSALHPDGELATARGASDAKAVMVATRQSDKPIDQVVAASSEPVWYQIYAGDPGAEDDAARAVEAGCRAVCVTVGADIDRQPAPFDWDAIGRLGSAVDVPVVAKGILRVDDARAALDQGARGLVVSNHGGMLPSGNALAIDVLPEIADAVGDQAPVLVDGSFRRGTDVLKGLALGATAVMVARPPMWGLTAYGAEGVQVVLEILQTELARNMASSGRPTIAMIDRELVRFDSR